MYIPPPQGLASAIANMSMPDLLAQASAGTNMSMNASPMGGTGYGYQSSYDPWAGTGINPMGGANGGGIGGALRGITGSLGGPGGVLNAATGAIGTIGNMYYAGQANKLAKKQFEYTKGVTDTNIANQIQSYNTRLGDIGRARAFTEGQSDETRDRYISENSLRDRRG